MFYFGSLNHLSIFEHMEHIDIGFVLLFPATFKRLGIE